LQEHHQTILLLWRWWFLLPNYGTSWKRTIIL